MRNQLKTILLFGVLSALLIGIGGAVAPRFLGLFVVLAAAMNLAAYFFSDKLVLRMYGARELAPGEAPELHAMVQGLSDRAGIPMPRLYLVGGAQPNAFATGRNPAHGAVAVTEGLLEALDAREVRGVLAHEIAHIANRDILVSTVAAILASAIASIANVLSFSWMFGGHAEDEDGGNPLAGLVMILFAPLAATLVQLAISRSRELRADEVGARIAGDPEGLARALERLDATAKRLPAHVSPGTASLFIVNPFGALDSVARWFSTHPPIGERVARLRAMAPGRPRRAFARDLRAAR
ncbi:MAG: zinc metalloprotease HtpX [Myxococcales bacterium]|nr:zinc metalloprotease HtpX [Myxococcales bacterium]